MWVNGHLDNAGVRGQGGGPRGDKVGSRRKSCPQKWVTSSFRILSQRTETLDRHIVLWARLGPARPPDHPSSYASTGAGGWGGGCGGGHERAFISRTNRLVYSSQGIKDHCKIALCSLSNIKRVSQHKRIAAITASEDHYQTSAAIRGNPD